MGGWMRYEEIVVAIVTSGLEDLAGNFLPQCRSWRKYRRTWAMVRRERVVRSWTDYILGSDHRIFQNVATRDLRHKSDYIVVIGCLRSRVATF